MYLLINPILFRFSRMFRKATLKFPLFLSPSHELLNILCFISLLQFSYLFLTRLFHFHEIQILFEDSFVCLKKILLFFQVQVENFHTEFVLKTIRRFDA